VGSAVLDLYGAEGTRGYAGTAAHAHLDGEEHRRFPGFLLLQQLVCAGAGCRTEPALGIAGQGIAFVEVYIGIFVHGPIPEFSLSI